MSKKNKQSKCECNFIPTPALPAAEESEKFYRRLNAVVSGTGIFMLDAGKVLLGVSAIFAAIFLLICLVGSLIVGFQYIKSDGRLIPDYSLVNRLEERIDVQEHMRNWDRGGIFHLERRMDQLEENSIDISQDIIQIPDQIIWNNHSVFTNVWFWDEDMPKAIKITQPNE